MNSKNVKCYLEGKSWEYCSPSYGNCLQDIEKTGRGGGARGSRNGGWDRGAVNMGVVAGAANIVWLKGQQRVGWGRKHES